MTETTASNTREERNIAHAALQLIGQQQAVDVRSAVTQHPDLSQPRCGSGLQQRASTGDGQLEVLTVRDQLTRPSHGGDRLHLSTGTLPTSSMNAHFTTTLLVVPCVKLTKVHKVWFT